MENSKNNKCINKDFTWKMYEKAIEVTGVKCFYQT